MLFPISFKPCKPSEAMRRDSSNSFVDVQEPQTDIDWIGPNPRLLDAALNRNNGLIDEDRLKILEKIINDDASIHRLNSDKIKEILQVVEKMKEKYEDLIDLREEFNTNIIDKLVLIQEKFLLLTNQHNAVTWGWSTIAGVTAVVSLALVIYLWKWNVFTSTSPLTSPIKLISKNAEELKTLVIEPTYNEFENKYTYMKYAAGGYMTSMLLNGNTGLIKKTILKWWRFL